MLNANTKALLAVKIQNWGEKNPQKQKSAVKMPFPSVFTRMVSFSLALQHSKENYINTVLKT